MNETQFEDSKFEDLVLENDTKKQKQKQIMLKVIVFLIVVLIVLIIFKIFNNSSSENIRTQETNASFEEYKDNETFENIKSIEEGYDNNSTSLEERLNTSESPAEPEILPATKLLPAKKVDNPAPIERASKIEPVAPTSVTPKPAPEPKPSKAQNSSPFDSLNLSKNSEKTTNLAPKTSASGIYIQVLAGSKLDLKSREIRKIKEAGYEYRLVEIDGKNGKIQRILIGPFSKDTQKAALDYVQEHIKKDAFFYRGKL